MSLSTHPCKSPNRFDTVHVYHFITRKYPNTNACKVTAERSKKSGISE